MEYGVPMFDLDEVPKDLLDCFEEITVECGAPWKRVTSTEQVKLDGRYTSGLTHGGTSQNTGAGGKDGGIHEWPRTRRVDTTLRWEPTCTCHGEFVKSREKVKVTRRAGDVDDTYDRDHSVKGNRNGKNSCTLDSGVETEEVLEEKEVIRYVHSIPLEEHPIRPCVILDPFMGSGTSAIVALDHGRRCVGIDLSKKYLDENAIPRIKAWFRSRPDLRHMVERVVQSKVLGRVVSSGKKT